MAGVFLGCSREFPLEKAVAFCLALTKDKGGGDGRGDRNVFKAPGGSNPALTGHWR
jgi:hypothetical protein